jgi:hypothetical protein
MEVSGQFHASAALPSGKQPPVPSGEEGAWAPEPFWRSGKRKLDSVQQERRNFVSGATLKSAKVHTKFILKPLSPGKGGRRVN